MRIQELERKTGLERPSIRFYEKEGLLNPKRLENGYREYSEADAELLKKIKLLRRLGMSIENIRKLQQGSGDLNRAITELISTHSTQIDDHKRCRAVCEAMREDGAEFVSLNADYYLKLLREIQIENKAVSSGDFREKVEKELHPWRRFFARWLDCGLWSTIITFVYIVVLRVRPLPGDFGSTLIGIAGVVLFIPVEALMLWKFGTTPGKFALGIRLESIQGGNLTWEEALRRSVNVFVLGNGCCIPLLEPVMKLVRYCEHTGKLLRGYILNGPQEMPWDEETEIIYRDVNFKRGAVIALMLVLELAIGIFAAFDGIRPKYRGNELTVQEFSANYNAFLRVFAKEHLHYEELKTDGTWKPVPANTVVFDMNDDRGNRRMEFEYNLESENIKSISIHHDWNAVSFLWPLDDEPYKLACSVLLAQKECGFRELIEFTQLYQAEMQKLNGYISYKNVIVQWNVQTDAESRNGYLIGDSENASWAELEYIVTIN